MLTTIGVALYILVFVGTYVLVALEVRPKYQLALTGAIVAVVIGHLFGLFSAAEFTHIIAHNLHALIAFFSLLLLAEEFRVSGLFQWLALKLTKSRLTAYSPKRLYFLLSLLTFFVTLCLTNIVGVVVMLILTLPLLVSLGVRPVAYALAITHIVSMAGASSMLGSLPALLAAMDCNISFVEYLAYASPAGLIATLIFAVYIYYLERDILPETFPVRREVIEEIVPEALIPNPFYFKLALGCLVTMITLLVIQPLIGIPVEYILLATAVVLTWNCPLEFSEIWRSLDYDLLLFVFGVFVLVGGLEKTGALSQFARGLVSLTRDPRLIAVLLGFLTFALSMIVENVSLTIMLLPVCREITRMLGIRGLQIYMAMVWGVQVGGTCFILGDPANFVTLSLLSREGIRIDAKEFLRYSFIPGVLAISVVLAWTALVVPP